MFITGRPPFPPFSAASASALANAYLQGDWGDTFAFFYADSRTDEVLSTVVLT